MDDRILEGYNKDFSKEFDLTGISPSKQFEHFVNYCVISSHALEAFDLEDVSVGDGVPGIDGIAIVVNDHLVTSVDEIDYFKKSFGKLDAKFIFSQAKTSARFDMGDIGNFLFAVRDFFAKHTSSDINEDLLDAWQLKEHLYDLSIDLEGPPPLLLSYATSGKWTSDANLITRIDSELNLLKHTNLFGEVNFVPLDSDKLKERYRELRNKVVKEIEFDKYITLPKIDGITEAYIGILPATQYLRLLTDAEGNLQKTLFYDNVRDFQGDNPVNREIKESIRDNRHNDAVVVLNNGITVVAKSTTKIGSLFKIRDFQVVNGCQTSHVLYLNRDAITEKVFIPFKLIVTENPEISNRVIKATNRQTEVKVEAFESLSPFHRKLEEFFATFEKEKGQRLYYERRSRQYENQPVPRTHVISIATQAKCFLAMFLDEPQSTHRYYGEILKTYRTRLFAEDHSPFPYYISAFSFYLLEQFFFTNEIPRFFKKYRYHMLTLFRHQVSGPNLPPLTSKKMDEYCDKLTPVLWNRSEALEKFTQVKQIIENALSQTTLNRYDTPRLRAFTIELLNAPRTERLSGTVKYYNDQRGFGFIEVPGEPDLFVHITAMRTSAVKELLVNQVVEFSIVEGKQGTEARDVEIIG